MLSTKLSTRFDILRYQDQIVLGTRHLSERVDEFDDEMDDILNAAFAKLAFITGQDEAELRREVAEMEDEMEPQPRGRRRHRRRSRKSSIGEKSAKAHDKTLEETPRDSNDKSGGGKKKSNIKTSGHTSGKPLA
jgi:hypothetical protein